jgi:hypothetical protein
VGAGVKGFCGYTELGGVSGMEVEGGVVVVGGREVLLLLISSC